MIRRPGGELATRPLHFIWMADCSGSMGQDGKIQALNTAVREALPAMRQVADNNPHAELLVRVLSFSDGAKWVVPQPTSVDAFQWMDLEAGGVTALGAALRTVADKMKMPPMPERALPPVLVLISDGQPTDDWRPALDALLNEPWGKRAVRLAIAIGRDADTDVLQQFINNSELNPLEANSAEALTRYIRWASTAVVQAASSPGSRPKDAPPPVGNVPIPQPPATVPNALNVTDVW